MSLKLCIVTPSHWKAVMGGSQYQAKILIEHLLRRYDVDITYLTTRVDPSYEPDGYEVVRFSEPTGLRRFAFFFDCRRLYRALARARPDVILQIVGSAHTGIAAFYAKRARCRMVWRVSSDRSIVKGRLRFWRVHKFIERLFLDYGIRNADLILAQSRYQREQLSLRYGRQDVQIVPNFHPVPGATLRTQGPPYVIVWISALKQLKNPLAFVRLAEKLADRPELSFVMVGRPIIERGAWTRRLLQDIASQPNISYLGELAQDQVNELLARAHILVNTSAYEGFANTFIQAWMRGVPVISLHVDPDELLSRGKLGLVSGTEDQLARDVLALIDDPSKRAGIGSRSRAYAIARHTVANIDDVARMLCMAPIRAQVPATA